MSESTVLITGFRPFARFAVNSSEEALARLGARPGWHTCILPVAHGPAAQEVIERIETLRPRLCLVTGLADGPVLRLEKRARRPRGEGGRFVLSGTWPAYEALAMLRAENLPVRMSNDAGRYVCESTYWKVLSYQGENGFPGSVGFLHLPPLERGFSADHLARGIERMIEARLANSRTPGKPTAA